MGSEEKLTNKKTITLTIGQAIAVGLFIFATIVPTSAWLISSVEDLGELKSQVKTLTESDQKKSIEYAEIQKDLLYLKTMMLDIQQSIKGMDK